MGQNWKGKGTVERKKYHVEEGNELLTNNKKRNDGAGIYKKNAYYIKEIRVLNFRCKISAHYT